MIWPVQTGDGPSQPHKASGGDYTNTCRRTNVRHDSSSDEDPWEIDRRHRRKGRTAAELIAAEVSPPQGGENWTNAICSPTETIRRPSPMVWSGIAVLAALTGATPFLRSSAHLTTYLPRL